MMNCESLIKLIGMPVEIDINGMTSYTKILSVTFAKDNFTYFHLEDGSIRDVKSLGTVIKIIDER